MTREESPEGVGCCGTSDLGTDSGGSIEGRTAWVTGDDCWLGIGVPMGTGTGNWTLPGIKEGEPSRGRPCVTDFGSTVGMGKGACGMRANRGGGTLETEEVVPAILEETVGEMDSGTLFPCMACFGGEELE